MIELNDWLSIDKTSGEGNDTITLTASNLAGVDYRNASIKIKTSTKEVIVYINQIEQDVPNNPNDIPNNELWVKTTDGSEAITHYDSTFTSKINQTILTNDGWTKFIFTEPLTEIDSSAFYSVEKLVSVVFPNSLTTIGAWAFAYTNLTGAIIIPDSVTDIKNDAFSYCTNLTSVYIGSGASLIYANPFKGTNLQSIEVSLNNTSYYAKDGCLLQRGCDYLQIGCSTSIIPNTVYRILDGAFYGNRSLTSIVIPSSVQYIGEDVCYGCSALTTVTINAGYADIDSLAFGYCPNLNRIICTTKASVIRNDTFKGIKTKGVLERPKSYSYSSWLSRSSYYLGYYDWREETY